jgi:hypothetical protein
MDKASLFDDIARILGHAMPRREAFRLIVGGLASGTFVSLLEPKQAQAATAKCREPCGDLINGITGTCQPNQPCESGTTCQNYVGHGCFCCSGAFSPGDCCCCPGEFCAPPHGHCCPNVNPNLHASLSPVRPGPPAQVDTTLRNAIDGICEVVLTKAVNCKVPGLPIDSLPAITTPIKLTATKIDQTKPARFEFSVCMCGPGGGCCYTVDPIFTVLKLSTGHWVRQTFADVPAAEHFVTVANGSPGLNRLHIWVNSRHFATLPLRDNESQSLNLAAAMTAQYNAISLAGAGELGASAEVNIADTSSATTTSGGRMAAPQALGTDPRRNAIWGPLAEETEENSHLHAANAASQTVQLNFNGAVSNAANPSAFAVEVNGNPVTVQSAHAQAGAAGTDVTLQLTQGTLRSGDSVDVYWDNLRGANGRPLLGHVPLFAE